jgi:hypothetical protein
MALMNGTLRSDDGSQVVWDIGNVGTVIIMDGSNPRAPPPPWMLSVADSVALAARGGACGARCIPIVVWDSYARVIARWHAKAFRAELERRGLYPVEDNCGPAG